MSDPAQHALSLAEQTKTVAAWDSELTELDSLFKTNFDVEISNNDPELERDAVEFVRLAKGLAKKIKGLRDEALEPLKDAMEQIKKIAGDRIRRADALAARVSDSLSALARRRYEEELEAKRAAMAKPASIVDEASELHPAVIERVTQHVERVKGTATLFDYGYHITNEAEIPRTYLQPNDALLKSEAKRKPSPPDIPGVEFWKRPKTSVRG